MLKAGGSPISERQILRMELDNQVPLDMNRRKLIARLLQIPPLLFGLGALEEVLFQPGAQAAGAVRAMQQTTLRKVVADTTRYHNTNLTIWQLHAASHAQSSLRQLHADIDDLESLERQSQGNLRYQVQEMLLSDLILATHIVRDQRQFELAYVHANEAVRVAKGMDDSDLIATALYTRGRTRLEWGQFGNIEQGTFQVQQDKIKAAIRDYQEAFQLFPARDDKERMHPQLLGVLTMFLSRARAIFAVSRGERIPASVLVALDDVADTVDRQPVDDPYTCVLVRGSRIGWHKASYLNERATVLNIAGLPGQALRELKAIDQLTEGTYSRDETRRFVWRDIQMANVYMGLEDFGTAAEKTKQALLACQDIHSVTNTAIITDIYGRLLNSRYKVSRDVKELGDILRESPVSFFE
jgi:tetratricopeptide (TPR) repeat protein